MVPMQGTEAVSPSQKEFPLLRHSCLSREEDEVEKRRAGILPLSLEEEAGLLSIWVPSAGAAVLPRMGSTGVAQQSRGKTQSSAETVFQSYLINPHLLL